MRFVADRRNNGEMVFTDVSHALDGINEITQEQLYNALKQNIKRNFMYNYEDDDEFMLEECIKEDENLTNLF